MGLTRTRFSQANTIVARIQDPITVLNSESTLANVDVGFLINRDAGSSSNVALFWKESTDEFVTALTSNAGVSDANLTITSYANLRVGTFFGNIGGGSGQANTYISGSLIPSANVAYDLGTDGRRFRDLWLSGTTLHMGDQRLTVTNGEWRFSTPTTTVVLGTESTVGNLTVTGNLNLQGSSSTFDSNNLSIQDSIIELHTLANLAPLTGDDGRDIGLKIHYYKTQDEHAFLGWSNSTGYLEWYDSGREGVGNVFTGNTFGTIKSGGARFVNTTPSTSTTTGALIVSGGVGIAGNLYIANTGDVSANVGTIKTNVEQLDANVSAYQTYANANAVAQAGSITSLTSNAATQHIAITSLDANIGNITTQLGSIASGANANTAAYLLTATGNIAASNIIASGNVYGGIVPTAIFKDVYIGSTAVSLARGTGALTVDNFNTTGYAAQANLATLATNATKTTVTSNISSGTAYVTFVNSTAGNVDQNINTALTYNPNSGNLTAYGLVTTAGLFWANGTAFSSSSYGNTDVALYLPEYSGTTNATIAQASQPNITDLGTLVNLDVSGATYLTGFVTMDGTGGGTPQYSVKMGNADGEKLGVITRGTAGYGIGLETLKDDESGYGKLNVTASEIHFNIKDGSASTVQNNAIVVQANGMVTLDSTTVSTSTTTGALVVGGGMGVAGNIQAGNVTVIGNVTGTTFMFANGVNILSTISAGSTYSNVNVEAYIGGNIGAYQTYANANAAAQATSINTVNANVTAANSAIQTLSANIGTLVAGAPGALDTLLELGNALGNSDSFSSTIVNWLGNITSNVTAANSSINTFNANLGAYQTYANANAATQATTINSIDANIGAYQTYANANAATQATSIDTINANVGAYQTYANANAATQATSINTIDANLGSFQSYANTKIGTNTNSNLVVVATTTSISTTTGALVVGGGVGIAGNVYANTVYTTTGIRWAGNGVAFSSGGGGGTFTANTAPPTSGNVAGDQWYDTSADILYEYLNDGTTSYWVDTISIGSVSGNTLSYINNSTLSGNIGLDANLIYSIGTKALHLSNVYTGNIFAVTANASIIYSGNVYPTNVVATNNVYSAGLYTTNGIFWSGNGVAISSSPGGTNTNIQYNNSGALAGATNFTYTEASGNIVVGASTPSTSTTTGALVVGGGIGVSNNLNVGGNISVTNNASIGGIASITGNTNISGNLTIAGNVTSNLSITGVTQHFNYTTVYSIFEQANITAVAPTGPISVDVMTAPVVYFTSNAAANVTVNIRGNSTTSLNSILGIGQSATIAIVWQNPATPYYPSTIQVDGSSITPAWQGASAPTKGNANSTDIYSYTIFKKSNAVFTILASQTQYSWSG
jgi:hypothetical protein